MKLELNWLEKRNKMLSSQCVDSYKPVKELDTEFRDYEPPGVQIQGKFYTYLSSNFVDRHKTE